MTANNSQVGTEAISDLSLSLTPDSIVFLKQLSRRKAAKLSKSESALKRTYQARIDDPSMLSFSKRSDESTGELPIILSDDGVEGCLDSSLSSGDFDFTNMLDSLRFTLIITF